MEQAVEGNTPRIEGGASSSTSRPAALASSQGGQEAKRQKAQDVIPRPPGGALGIGGAAIGSPDTRGIAPSGGVGGPGRAKAEAEVLTGGSSSSGAAVRSDAMAVDSSRGEKRKETSEVDEEMLHLLVCEGRDRVINQPKEAGITEPVCEGDLPHETDMCDQVTWSSWTTSVENV